MLTKSTHLQQSQFLYYFDTAPLTIHDKTAFCAGRLHMFLTGKPAYHYVEIKRATASIFETKVKSGLVDVAQYGRVVKSGWGDHPPREVVTEVENSLLERLEPDHNPVADCTPLHIAVYKEKEDLVKILLEHGADVNVHDSFGHTPAHLAAMRGNLRILKLLEKAGARLDLKDSDGNEVVGVAKANEHLIIANYVAGKIHLDLSQVTNFWNTVLKKNVFIVCSR